MDDGAGASRASATGGTNNTGTGGDNVTNQEAGVDERAGNANGAGGTLGQGGVGEVGAFGPDDGLVAQFGFDDTTGSVARNRKDPTKNGAYFGACLHPDGRVGTAVSIRNAATTTTPTPPATDWIELPTGLLSGLSATTVAIWMRDLSTAQKGGRLFDFSLGASEGIYFAPDQTDSTNSLTGGHLGGMHAGSPFVDLWSSTPMLTDKAWHHIAFTWSAASIVLYIDGRPVGRQPNPGLVPSDLGTTSPNWLGRTLNDAFLGLYAEMDDLRVYDRALAAAEIAKLYAMY